MAGEERRIWKEWGDAVVIVIRSYVIEACEGCQFSVKDLKQTNDMCLM